MRFKYQKILKKYKLKKQQILTWLVHCPPPTFFYFFGKPQIRLYKSWSVTPTAESPRQTKFVQGE